MALPATTEFDVRTTGNDNNGGAFDTASGGTDYSQQDSPQLALTDLVGNGTSTVTSATGGFTSQMVGNVTYIQGARYSIASFGSTNSVTLDRATGTFTGGTCNVGGSCATIATALGSAVSGNKIHVKNSGTYTHTAAAIIGVASIRIIGYNSTHNDLGAKPTITSATSAVDLFQQTSTGGVVLLDNLNFTHTGGTRGNVLLKTTAHDTTGAIVMRNCTADGTASLLNGDNAGFHYDWAYMLMTNVYSKNCVGTVCSGNGSRISLIGCVFDNSGAAYQVDGAGTLFASHCIFKGGTSGCINQNGGSNHFYSHCDFYSSVRSVFGSSSGGLLIFDDCIVYSMSTYGIDGNSTTPSVLNTASALAGRNNALGANGTDRHGYDACLGDISLSGSPFTTSTNFALNGTAGAGAACKGAAFPSTFPDGSTVGALDIGAVQSAVGGGGGSAGVRFHPGMTGGAI